MRNIVREPAGTTTRRRPSAALALATLMALLVAGCAAPQTGPAGSTAAAASPAPSAAPAQPVAAPAPPARGTPAPPMSTPLPAERAANPPPPAGPTARLDVSCKTNADCVVKDVGNCCGYYPRCVNVNAAVDPKAVQAQCARNGMASVCGFKPVEGCECVKGECQDKMMLLEGR